MVIPDLETIIQGFFANVRKNLKHRWNSGWMGYYRDTVPDLTPLPPQEQAEIYMKQLEMVLAIEPNLS